MTKAEAAKAMMTSSLRRDGRRIKGKLWKVPHIPVGQGKLAIIFNRWRCDRTVLY